ncbi:MAG TPA: HD domain-containing phosphohydrolase, partial [Gaiellaceae bacterium]|nr:HD domain-containing phosphohydrolase [Gaiellaceae bacterium]
MRSWDVHPRLWSDRRRGRSELSKRVTVILALGLTAAVYAARYVDDDVAGMPLLLLGVPVALCGVWFGFRGGVFCALLAVGLTTAWYLHGDVDAGPIGSTLQATALLVLGGLVGHFAEKRRALEERVSRHEELSLDLICTANFDGFFTRLNPSWTRILGYSTAELMAEPFLAFVHPDDRDATIAEAERQTNAGEPVLHFANRYRHKDGGYRWLEWMSRPDADAGELIAVARDITARKTAEETVRRYQELLEREVSERTRDLEAARLEILRRLALAAEYRDDDTFEHTERVARTAAALTELLGLPRRDVNLMRQAAPLHDIGKLGISDTILLKPGKLTEQEFDTMRLHAELGAEILSGSRSDVLQLAERIALTHHEWWNGDGYPRQLRAEEIPQCGRIVALADVYDALTHARPYKEAWPVERAVDEVHRLRG